MMSKSLLFALTLVLLLPYCCWSVPVPCKGKDCEVQGSVPLGPAIPTATPPKYTDRYQCPPQAFIQSLRVHFPDPKDRKHAKVELGCSQQPAASAGCNQSFAVGFLTERIESVGIVVLEMECGGRGEWMTVYDDSDQCAEGARLQPRFRCPDGHAVCGIELGPFFVSNFRLHCCPLPAEYAHLTLPKRVNTTGYPYEIIGALKQPEDNAIYKLIQFCNDGNAFGLITEEPRSNYIRLDVNCGTIREDLEDCPWQMTGARVRTSSVSGKTVGIEIGCWSGSWRITFVSTVRRGEASFWERGYRCSPGWVVCGYQVQENFIHNFRLLCCPQEEEPCVPAKLYRKIVKSTKSVGIKTAFELDVKDFQDKVNPLAKLIMEKFETLGLAIPKDLSVVTTSNRERDLYQLVATCGPVEIRFDKFQHIEDKCELLNKANALSCKCNAPPKKAHTCKASWISIAITTEDGLFTKLRGIDYTQIHRNKKAIIHLGLFERPRKLERKDLNSYSDFNNLATTAGLIESIELLTCDYLLPSLKGFDFTKRVEAKPLGYEYGVSTFYFQLKVICGDFQFRLDKYETYSTRESWHRIITNCEIPLAIGVTEESVMRYCGRL